MGFLVKKSNNENIKKRMLLNQAFKELKQETGIDHQKLIMGDGKEKNKLIFKQYQEKMRLEQNEKNFKK